MSTLVTGGAGYIGSHLVRLLAERGATPVVADDLTTGSPTRIPGIPLLRVDLASPGAAEALEEFMRAEQVSAVVHFAARKQVAESVARPDWYFEQNLGSLRTVLAAATETGVRDVVFSSSAAVYGEASGLLREDSRTMPVNPYGHTKLLGERLTADVAAAKGMRAVSLRYFNVAGAGWPELADTALLNLVPLVLDRLGRGESPQIYGDDYPTADGTCIRDYVHVLDVAEAHLAVLDALEGQAEPHRVFNIGTGVGSSVREVVEGLRRRAQEAPPATIRPRRPGDPAQLVADPSRIAAELGWRARFGLDDILDSAWAARLSPRPQ